MQIGSYGSTNSYYQALAGSQRATRNIASGLKVNNAADNAAAMAILQGMYGQINGEDQANNNIQDSVSLLNTSDGAMGSSSDVIQRMRELTVEAANSTLTDDDRASIQQEMSQLGAQLDSNANNT